MWRYAIDGIVLEKRVLMPHRLNSVHITYRLLEGVGPVRLTLRPSLNFRRHEAPVSTPLAGPYSLLASHGQYEIAGGDGLPPLRLVLHGGHARFTNEEKTTQNVLFPVEESRGYEARGGLWSPGYFRADLSPGDEATLIGSTEPWEAIHALPPPQALAAEIERRRRLLALAAPSAREGPAADLVLAADQFIVAPRAGKTTTRGRAPPATSSAP